MSDEKKVALIYGVTGQLGSYLAEILLKKEYKVIGVKRRTSLINTGRVDHLYCDPNFKLRYGDMNDVGSMYSLLNEYKPTHVFSLAAQSHVLVSFENAETTADSIAMGAVRLLNATREIVPEARFYNAASSELYGDNPDVPLNEESRFSPVSPYACAKLYAYYITKNYRNSYGMFASNGILFNNESSRRGETFVSRKITMAAARIKLGLQNKLALGNLKSKRDWTYSKDSAEAVVKIMEHDMPDDFVICSGESHTVEEFVATAFEYAGIENYEKYVEIDPKYFRPQEVPFLLGDCSKAKNILGWKPSKTFKELVQLMYDSDYQLALQELEIAKMKWKK